MIKENWCAPSVSKLAKDLKAAVKDLWETRDEGGCYHWPIYYEENGQEWDVVLGWAEGYDEDPDIYYEDGYAICASVRYQTANNGMQTDLNVDFLMPCNEDGDCWDADNTISKKEDYNYLAKYLLDEGKKMVEEYADKDVDEDDEDEDFDESRQRRGHMLREETEYVRGKEWTNANLNYKGGYLDALKFVANVAEDYDDMDEFRVWINRAITKAKKERIEAGESWAKTRGLNPRAKF